MKNIIVFVVILVSLTGCQKRPVFTCPECIKTDSIIRITDTVAYAFPDELTLQALAECDSFGKVTLRQRDSIAKKMANLKPITITRYKVFQTTKEIKTTDKNALKAAWEQGAKYIKSQVKEKGFFDSWINLLWCSIGLIFFISIIVLIKNIRK